MKLFQTEHLFAHPWCTMTLANWRKYPNEYSSHVLSVDVLSRDIDPQSGILTTERLLCCKQSAPSFVRKLFHVPEVAYFREVSILDPRSQTYTASSVNLSMRQFMKLEERCEYRADPDHPEGRTVFTQTAAVSAMGVLSYAAKLIEEAAVKSYHNNAARGKKGLETIIDKVVEEAKMMEKGLIEGIEHGLEELESGLEGFKRKSTSFR
ncbi:PRELI-like family-domain-containing protein [Gaertneriomyces semiglobifer]|nr:PRELI-like family-domain-containing protein [Gaertneriomyces semiglobifer]